MEHLLAKLEKCPFCGMEANLIALDSKKYFMVQCPEQSKCRGVLGVIIPCNRIAEGVDAWNSRANFGFDEIQIVTNLSLGINPINGLKLSKPIGGGVYKKRQAYLSALKESAKVESIKNLKDEKFNPAGFPSLSRRWAEWSAEEDSFLLSIWVAEDTVPIHRIAQTCGRSVGAIESRLVALGAASNLQELRSKNREKLRLVVASTSGSFG